MTLWTPQNALRAEPYRVLLKRGEFVDDNRGGRAVPYKIYHPSDENLEHSPVILWSHGFGGNRDGASFISRYLAEQGYTIVHMTHDGTDSSLWEGKDGHAWDILRKTKVSRETTLNRMLDVPFVLDQLPLWAKENPEIGDIMGLDNGIGMSGHSFGAMTTAVMAGMQFPNRDNSLSDLRDDRLCCGILYSPTPIAHITNAAPEDVYGPIRIPVLHMTGTEDDSPIENYGYEHRLVIRDHAQNPEQYTHILDGGDHMIYNGTRGKLGDNPNRDAHEREIQETAFAFWEAYLRNDDAAKEWLKTHHMPA